MMGPFEVSFMASAMMGSNHHPKNKKNNKNTTKSKKYKKSKK